MRQARIFSLLLLLAAFMAAEHCAAVNPSPTWYSRVWQTEDGLPSASINGVAQTKDGYLWLATQSGLARFDGLKVTNIAIPSARSLFIRTMFCDSTERFWLGSPGGELMCLSNSQTLVFSITNGLSDSAPLQIIESRDHTIWIAYGDGSLCRIDTNNQVSRLRENAHLPTNGICSLAIDRQGQLWIAKDTWVGTFKGNAFERVFQAERGSQILPARDDGIWVATSTQLLKCKRNGQSTPMASFEVPTGHLKSTVLFEDSADRLWVGSAADGLWVLEAGRFHKVTTSQNKIRAVTEDREGNIWVGTDGGGLNRLRQSVIELFGREEGLPFETVRSLSEDAAGNLWVATQDGTLTALIGERWGEGQLNLNWPGGNAHCVLQDHDGAVWIGTYRRGLYRWADGKFKQFSLKDGLAGNSVRSLLLGHAGELWIGLETGSVVQRYQNGKFESFALPEGSRAVRAMAEDSSGQIWLGTLDGRLLRWHEGVMTDVTLETANPRHPIRCLSALPDGNVWIGYAAGGLGRIKAGHFSQILEDQGLYDNNVCAFMPDDQNRVWIAADRGLFCVDLRELNAAADTRTNHLNSIVYGRDDGLPGLQAYYGYSPGPLRTRAGDILFPTHSGIAIVHPARAHANLVSTIVRIEKVTAADIPPIVLGGDSYTHFPPGLRNLEITFTAPSFIAPEQIQFQYLLEGWDDSWVDAGRDRRADYARLPPGKYSFRVRARNNSGVWSQNNAQFHFVLEPYFWQSSYFAISLGALLVFGLIILVRHFSLRRARAMLKRAEQVSALQNERSRIAQDMHDDLGAQFTQISLLGELARTALQLPEKSGEYLDKISAVARAGVKSLDEIVWAVNPRNDMLPDLLDYAGQYALNFLSAAGITCRLDFPENPPAREMSGEFRHAIFLIIKEALNNVVRHSQARHVRLFFDFDQTEMRWAIEDNGLGFAKTPDDALADGLRNMRQRTVALGGEFVVKSSPGGGTKIRMTIPWHS